MSKYFYYGPMLSKRIIIRSYTRTFHQPSVIITNIEIRQVKLLLMKEKRTNRKKLRKLYKSRNNINELAFKTQKVEEDNTCTLLQPIGQ